MVPSRPENRARFPPWKGRANHQAVDLEAVTPGPANRTSTHALNERSVFLRREEGKSSSFSQRAHAEAGAGAGARPPPPEWPAQFAVSFRETNLWVLKTRGRFWYDASLEAERVDRDSGLGDRYCGTARPLSSTPCSHVVAGGVRYLRFPEKGQCCRCCDAEHGCGFLRQDWLQGARFVGPEAQGGEAAWKWEVDGLQNNYVWTAAADGRPVRVLQAPNDDMRLRPDFRPGPVDPAVFDVGDCQGDCGGVCARLRAPGPA